MRCYGVRKEKHSMKITIDVKEKTQYVHISEKHKK